MEKGVFGQAKDFVIRGIDHHGLDGITLGEFGIIRAFRSVYCGFLYKHV